MKNSFVVPHLTADPLHVMQESNWRISTNSKTEKGCRKIVAKIQSMPGIDGLKVNYEKHWESGEFIASFILKLNCSSKDELMFELIRLGQLIGYDWQLNGSIEIQTSAFSRRSRISGIEMAEWDIDIPEKWRLIG